MPILEEERWEVAILRRSVNALERSGVPFMGFEGGEPLLRKDLEQILEESYKKFYTSLVTNGLLLKDKAKGISEYLYLLME